jgi:RNA polymerase sigma-70 factor (ECF subfamily)
MQRRSHQGSRSHLQEGDSSAYVELTDQLEQFLEVARPRLASLARTQGVPIDAIDDVVQDTLLEAWRHVDHLRTPERFEAWLHGICRNVCRRWARAQNEQRSQGIFPSLEEAPNLLEFDIADPSVLDPAEELSRQDLTTLLDKALGSLSDENRQLIELCYLVEMPRSEIALHLRLTISALESRLRRARRQLQHVLTGTLRTDAEAFGLAIGDEQLNGWRESREWCLSCGRHRLYGIFEPLADGRIDLRMRCPACSHQGYDELTSGGHVSLRGLHSFRPARKRVLSDLDTFIRNYHEGWGKCPRCGERRRAFLMSYEQYFSQFLTGLTSPIDAGLCLFLRCSTCGIDALSDACAHVFSHPLIQHFLQQHPRAIRQPQSCTEYAGAPVLQIGFIDLLNASRITAYVHRETLQILAVLEK